MSDEIMECSKMDAKDLYRALDEFCRNNSYHNNIEYRWLAQQAIPLKNLAHDLGVNGIASFAKKHHDGITELRLAEIEDERSKIAKSDAKLADEAERLKRRPAA